jgi:DNA-binding MarR family transcriptional regulator
MDEIDKAVEKLRLVVRLLNRRAQADTGEGSPTRSEQAVLAWLEEKGPLTPGVLAGLEHVRPQSMGQTLDALAGNGLVARLAHPTDRRQTLIKLTRIGRHALNRGRNLRQAWLVEAVRNDLAPEERKVLFEAIDLLDRIVRG